MRKIAAAALVVALPPMPGCDNGQTQQSAAPQRQEAPFVPPKARHGNHVFAGGVAPPSQPLENPYRGDAQSAAAGKQLFTAMHCDGCHAAGAVGAVGPSLADGRWRYGGSSAEILESIFAGRANGMPAYGGVLSKEAIWQLVSYLQALTPAIDPATVAFPQR